MKAHTVEVHFQSNSLGKDLRVVATLTERIKGVFIFPFADGTTNTAFAQKHGLGLESNVHLLKPEIVIKEKSQDKEVAFETVENDGPGVCYWVEGNLVCW